MIWNILHEGDNSISACHLASLWCPDKYETLFITLKLMKLRPDNNLIVKMSYLCPESSIQDRGGNTVESDLDEKCEVSGAGRQNGWGQVHFPPRLTLRIQPSLLVYLAGQGCLRTVYQAAVWGWLLSTDKKLITPHMYKLLTEDEVYAQGCEISPTHTPRV